MTATDLRRESHPQAAAPSPRLTTRIADSLPSIPAEEWDRLLGAGNGSLGHGYLSAWENVELAGLCSRPVLAFAEGHTSPVAACPGYFYDLDLPTVRHPQGSLAVEAVRRIFPNFLIARTYELGSPTPLTNPFLVADERLRATAVRQLIQAGLAEADRGGAEFTLVQNFTSRSTPAGEVLGGELGFAGVPILPTAVITLLHGSFEEYVGAMRSQYRRRVKQAFKRSGHLTVEHRRDFAELADELARLWRAIYERASEVRREVLTPQYFRALARVPQASVLLTRRPNGALASFALLLDDRPWLSFLQCGFEEASRREAAYFRLLYEIVRFGIEGGYEHIELGITTLEPKLDVGAVPVPLFAWLKHRNPIIQRLLSALARGPLQPPKVEPRHVFKDPPPSGPEIVAQRALSS